ncbi:MAG: hypothetical protein JWO38_6195 [Gemmataceae bacterium]|nr:hypothetical protein [Gemmataceae bacterium]
MARTNQQYADEMLAEGLATGKTVVEAARAAGVSERTAYRRMKDPAIQARVNEVRAAVLATAYSKLNDGLLSACDHLNQLVGHDNPHVQIRAAKTVIQLTLKVRADVDFGERLFRLEEETARDHGLKHDTSLEPPFYDAGSEPSDLGPPWDPPDPSDPGDGPFGPPGPPPPPPPDRPGPGGGIVSPTGNELPGTAPTRPAPATDGGTADRDAASGQTSSRGNEVRSPGAGERAEVGFLSRPPLIPPQPGGEPTGAVAGCLAPSPVAGRAGVGFLLLLLVGLLFALAGTNSHPERAAAADRRCQTCQTLPDPARGFVSRHGLPGEIDTLRPAWPPWRVGGEFGSQNDPPTGGRGPRPAWRCRERPRPTAA